MLENPLALRCIGVSRRFGQTLAVDAVTLDVPTGAFASLLGPSGCGKTTLLRIIAGLERPDAGTVEIDGREVDGPSGHLAPEERSVGMVFQAHALFPHLDIGRNVAFGLRDLDRTARRRRVAEVLELVGLTGLERRMPAQLSGGQQQRVALARALAPSPSLLLLDEPFSSLDAALRATVREEVRSILQTAGQTALLVTHDQEEALSITDRVGVMFDGRLHQIADPETLYREPATRQVAGFVGDADLVAGTRAASFMVDTPFGRLPTAAPVTSEQVTVVVRPENVDLRAEVDGPATVRHVTFYGHDTLVEVVLEDGTALRSRSGPDARLERGQRVRPTITGTVVTFGHRPEAVPVAAAAAGAPGGPSAPDGSS
jgi:iron(III) transport system ATP-binding protein